MVFSEVALTREEARQKCEEGFSKLVSFGNFVDFFKFKRRLNEMKIEEDIWLGKQFFRIYVKLIRYRKN